MPTCHKVHTSFSAQFTAFTFSSCKLFARILNFLSYYSKPQDVLFCGSEQERGSWRDLAQRLKRSLSTKRRATIGEKKGSFFGRAPAIYSEQKLTSGHVVYAARSGRSAAGSAGKRFVPFGSSLRRNDGPTKSYAGDRSRINIYSKPTAMGVAS